MNGKDREFIEECMLFAENNRSATKIKRLCDIIANLREKNKKHCEHLTEFKIPCDKLKLELAEKDEQNARMSEMLLRLADYYCFFSDHDKEAFNKLCDEIRKGKK